MEERWAIKNPLIEEADLILGCDEWPWMPTRPNAHPPSIYRYHTQWCIENGYCCGNVILDQEK